MNTKITYLYRDASNWKQFEEIIVRGAFTEEQIDTILNSLTDYCLFIPSDVGLWPLHDRWPTLNEDDHIYHELERKNFELVEDEPTLDITIEELAERFRTVDWDPSWAQWVMMRSIPHDPNADFDNPIW